MRWKGGGKLGNNARRVGNTSQMHFFEVRRANLLHFFEKTTECLYILKAKFVGYFLYRLIRVPKHSLCF